MSAPLRARVRALGWTERALASQPVWQREWRASSRVLTTPWLTAVTGMAMPLLLILIAMKERYTLASELGPMLFHVYFGLSALFVTLFGPAIAANSIALEREGKTWEALQMAGVAPRAIDRGKFLGAFTQLMLAVLALLPSAAIPMFYGGVTHRELALGVVMVVVMGALAVRFGLAISSALPSSRTALLATVLSAAMLAAAVGIVGVAGARWLADHAEVHGLARDSVVFWPVALVHSTVGFDYVRYLVLAPFVFSVLGWVTLRELTVASLTMPPSDPHGRLRVTFALGAPLLALTLALLPNHRWDELFSLELVFAAFVFGAVIVLGAARSANARVAVSTSLLVLSISAGGMSLIGFLGPHVLALDLARYQGDDGTVRAMMICAPAFTTLLVGVAAFARSWMSTPGKARAVVFLTPAVLSTVAAALSIGLTLAHDGHTVSWPIAFCPFVVLKPEHVGSDALALGACSWVTTGLTLIALAYRRDRVKDVARSLEAA